MAQWWEERWWLVGENEKLGSGWGIFHKSLKKEDWGVRADSAFGEKKGEERRQRYPSCVLESYPVAPHRTQFFFFKKKK